MEKVYRALVISLLLTQLLWFFMPWSFAYDEISTKLLQWLGYDSLFSFDAIAFISNVFLVLYLLACLGLIFYNFWLRRLYVVIVVLGGLVLPFYGLSVMSGYESVLVYYLTLGDGIVLAMSYLTNINNKFIE